MTSELSLQAQAILDAYNAGFTRPVAVHHKPRIAAALEAVADQVVPQPPMLVEGGRTYDEAWTTTVHNDIRNRILAIAAELRFGNTTPTETP